jgi:hypothetical protein
MSDSFSGRRRSRRGFLRDAAGVLAAGVGLTLVGTEPAQAQVGEHCCRQSDCPYCPGGSSYRYRCQNFCTGRVYCTCINNSVQCLDRAC